MSKPLSDDSDPDLPDGWEETDPDDRPSSTVATCARHYTRSDGRSVTIWAGVEPGSARYKIYEDHNYSIEITDGDELVAGVGVVDRHVAQEQAIRAMETLNGVKEW